METEVPAFDQPLPLDRLGCLTLASGGHSARENGVCLMEAVAWVAGEPHSDHPACACPVLAAWGRGFNDGLPSDEDRARLLKPLIPLMVGTRATKEIAERRAFLAMDWLIRTHTPAWLELRESTRPIAAALRALPPIVDLAALVAAQPALEEARALAAKDEAAARDATRDAAWDAARDAARVAAWDAAWDAARDAARAAAWDAAMAILTPVVAQLQESAIELFHRMVAVKE